MRLNTRPEDLKRRRLGRGWNQADLAEAAGVHVNTIQNAEAGASVRALTARGIAEALGCTIADIADIVDDRASAEATA